jgi:copper chaperone CopZ
MKIPKVVHITLFGLGMSLLTACSSVSSILPAPGDAQEVNEVLKKVEPVMQKASSHIDYKYSVTSTAKTKRSIDEQYKIHYVDDNNLTIQKIKGEYKDEEPIVYIDGTQWVYDDILDKVTTLGTEENAAKAELNDNYEVITNSYFMERIKAMGDEVVVKEEGNSIILSAELKEGSQKSNETTELEKLLKREKSDVFEVRLADTKLGENGSQLVSYQFKMWIDKKTNRITKVESITNAEIMVITKRNGDYVEDQEGVPVVVKETLTFSEAPNTIAKPEDKVTAEEKSEAEYH